MLGRNIGLVLAATVALTTAVSPVPAASAVLVRSAVSVGSGTSAVPVSTTATVSPQAAVIHGWGPVVAGDEFEYSGRPDSSKWSMYDSSGHDGKGLRRPSQWQVADHAATVTGLPNGTTGGMSARFSHRKYGRWETRMRTNHRSPQYHPMAMLWPDSDRSRCNETDYVESTGDPAYAKFFLHYACPHVQTQTKRLIDMTQWHNYAVQWTPSGVVGYIDGAEWFRDNTHSPGVSMHQTLQLDWFPTSSATTTTTMSVRWVRVYNP